MLAVDSDGAAYFGGTTGFKDAKDPVEGRLDTKNADTLIFTAADKPRDGIFSRAGDRSGGTLPIPYAQIIDIEYGQKAGRRVGAAVGYTLLLGLWVC